MEAALYTAAHRNLISPPRAHTTVEVRVNRTQKNRYVPDDVYLRVSAICNSV